MKATHLSIDLDYWSKDVVTVGAGKRSMMSFLRRLLDARCPITMYVEHHQVLEMLTGKKLNRVINVDYHDDIVLCDDVANTPPEACWANKPANREAMVYEWRYPSWKTCCFDMWGLCSNKGDQLWPMQYHEWKYIHRQQGLGHIPWNDIVSASVVLSPRFTCPVIAVDAADFLAKTRRVRKNAAVAKLIKYWKTLFPS